MAQLLLTAVATLLLGAAFVGAGLRVSSRPSWVGDRRALQALSMWWILMGCKFLADGVRKAFALELDVRIFAGLMYAEVLVAFAALAGLTCYLYYLWYGRYFARTVALAYLVPAVVYIGFFAAHGPLAVDAEGYRGALLYREPIAPWLHWVLLTGFYAPLTTLAAGFAYLGKATPAVRERAWQIAATLAAITLADLLAAGPSDPGPLTIAIPLLRLTAMVLVVWAYASPAQRRATSRLAGLGHPADKAEDDRRR